MGSDSALAPGACPGDDLWSMGILPILAGGALAGFFGLYWDISWHIDKGRDTFFTPPHDFLYAGLATVLVVGLYGLWRDRRETPFHLSAGAFRAQPGVLIVAAAAALVLAFAPLDDLWHRLFGVDVTLWGPMHLVGILGLVLARFGGLVCAWIERDLSADPRRRRLFGDLSLYFAVVLLAGAVVVTGEYEFMVPQFPMVFHPILLAGLPMFTLILISRLAPRPWSATLVTIGFTALRLVLAWGLTAASHLNLAGVSQPAIPLLIPTGLAVDLLRARGAPGWAAGAIGGGVTLVANLVFIDASAPTVGGIRLFWTATTILHALVPALALSAAMGAAGAAVAESLGPRVYRAIPRAARAAALRRSRA